MRLLTLAAFVVLALGAFAGTAQAQIADDSVAGRTFTLALAGPGGEGTAVVTVNPGLELVCYRIDVELTEGDEPAEPAPGLGTAHIHVLPSGRIAVDLDAEFVETDGAFTATGCVEAERETLIAIFMNPEAFYVNVHTITVAGGAVQGFFR